MPLLLLLLALTISPVFAAEFPPDEGDSEEMTAPETPRPAPRDAATKELPPGPPEEPSARDFSAVLLQGLNKVTGHTLKFDAPVGAETKFGNLKITAHRCWQASPEDTPENAALLEIIETKPDEGPRPIFLGWMFSSSPGLSALEHPVYDITVITCETLKPAEKEKPTVVPPKK